MLFFGLVSFLCRPSDAKPDGCAAPIRVVCVAGRGHKPSAAEVPSAAAQGVVGARGVVVVHHPFPDVAAEIVDPEVVWQEGVDGRGEFEVILLRDWW